MYKNSYKILFYSDGKVLDEKEVCTYCETNETIELQKNIENNIKEFIKNNEILHKKFPQPIINLTDKEINSYEDILNADIDWQTSNFDLKKILPLYEKCICIYTLPGA